MSLLTPDRRRFLAAGSALSMGAVLTGNAAAQTAPASAASAALKPPGRMTFHGIDTFHGATIGTLHVDVARFEGGAYKLIKSFDTVPGGRSDGPVFEAATFQPGRYELTLYVAKYFASLDTKLPTPTFYSQVPLRFGIADAAERYHIAVLFGPWSYSYYRGT